MGVVRDGVVRPANVMVSVSCKPEEVVHARNVIAFFVWAWPLGFCD